MDDVDEDLRKMEIKKWCQMQGTESRGGRF
jgi:hypothetical protein